MTADDTNPFWEFSLKFYQRDGVADVCLELQDRLGLDVNIVLLTVWLAGHGHTASVSDLEQVDGKIAEWRDQVIVPLRRLRRWLRAPDSIIPAEMARDYRAEIKSAELEGERIAQQMIFLACSHLQKSAWAEPGDLRRALSNYMKMKRVSPGGSDEDALDVIASAFERAA